jgi:hemerythrin-like domain-containing protein
MLAPEHRRIMDELIQEHIHGRNTVEKLVSASQVYERGDKSALSEIRDCFLDLTDFYPKHIDREDNHFFMPCMEYFSDEEKDALLEESWRFDKTLIHEKYRNLVEHLE